MKCYAVWVLVLAVLLAPIIGAASDGENYYSNAALLREQPRLESRIHELLYERLWRYFSSAEQRAIREVRLEFPLREESPLEFYLGERGGQLVVVMPILSLLFLEDLSTAYAWLWGNDYSMETVDEYITMLWYKRPSDFPGRRYPPPLEALQIPGNARTDPKVDDISLRFRNTTFAFILLHELGHALYGHRGDEGIPLAQARENEENADRFALEIFRRTRNIPSGIMMYFLAQAYMMPNKGKFIAAGHAEEEWELYLRTQLTHPLTTRRLELIAQIMDRTADELGPGNESDVWRYIATRLIQMVEILEDMELQACMADVAIHADPASLAPRRLRAGGSPLEKWCGSSSP